jgi:pimeloyl-ACP methyl ester carboxylesterase
MSDIRESFATTPRGRVRYLEAGSGWPVVLLHAFPLSADMWRPQLERPLEGWRFLAPDLRGLGPHPLPPAQTLDEMADDVGAWLDVLEIETAAIGGVSMGGYVTFALFRNAPERFSAVILANTRAAADRADGRAGRDKMSALVREHGVAAVADQMIPKLLGSTSQQTRPDLAPRLRRTIESNTADGIDGAIQAMKVRPDSTALLPGITRPALVIAGAEDTLIPVAESEAMHTALPRSQFVTLPTAGHLSNLETPAEFSAALADFLRATI